MAATALHSVIRVFGRKISITYHRNENGWSCEHGDVWDWVPAAELVLAEGHRELLAGQCVDHSVMYGMLDTRCLVPATSADRN